MGKLYSCYREEVLDRTIVDILTTNKERTSVWAPLKKGRIVPDIIGINSVCRGVPVKTLYGFHERGFIDPNDKSALYLINAETRGISIIPSYVNLFHDQDKVQPKNEFVWHGTIPEILQEFKKADYEVVRV